MGEKERSVVDKNLPRLQKGLNAKNVMKHLKRSGVVDDKEEEFIMKKKGGKSTKEDQVVALLDVLKGRTDGFTVLVTALAQSKSQDHLAKELLQDSTFTPQGEYLSLIYWTPHNHLLSLSYSFLFINIVVVPYTAYPECPTIPI